MNDKKVQERKLFYLLKSVSGADEGVYEQSDLPHLPREAQKHIVPLAVAAALGYIEYDRTAEGNINSLPIYASVNPKTKTIKKIRGIEEGLVQPGSRDASFVEKLDVSTHKIGNTLRDTFQNLKQKSAEDSLKAKIEAKKKELENTKE
jgi:hypothetical protein